MFSFLVVLLEISLFNAKTRVKSPANDSKYETNKQILAFEPNKETKTEIVENFAGCIGPDEKCKEKGSTTLAQISEQNKGKDIEQMILEFYSDANLDELDVSVTGRLDIQILSGKLTGKLIIKNEDTEVSFYGNKESLSDIALEIKSSGKLYDIEFLNEKIPSYIFAHPIKELTIDYGIYFKKGDIVVPYCSTSSNPIGTVNLKVSEGTFTPKLHEKVKATYKQMEPKKLSKTMLPHKGGKMVIKEEEEEMPDYYIYKYKIEEGSKSNVGLIVGVVVAVVVVIVIVVVVVVFVVLKKKKKNDNSSH